MLPKSLLRQYDKIKYYSRLISKKRNKNPYYIHSKSYYKAITKLNNAYTKAYNTQEANLNNIVKYFFMNYNRIVIEDLDVSRMLKNKHLSEKISEQNFYKFREILTYKCKLNNIELVIADKFYPSSKTCSCCGHIKQDLKLKDRVFKCPNCGFEINRDLNAAINLSNYK